jgi:hypothetical protein
MKPERIPSPEADEYAPFYAGYVALARERDPLGLLKRQAPVLRATCTGMTDAEAHHRYAPGKWSIKEVLGHLADTERVLSYRLLRISRGDPTPTRTPTSRPRASTRARCVRCSRSSRVCVPPRCG